MTGRYYARSADGESITAYATADGAEQAALELGEGAHMVDALAPAYVPMIQQVVDGKLRILGVGGWGADRLSLEQNFLQAIKRKQPAIVHAFYARGAHPDTRDEHERPAIIWAVASGRLETVRFLLDKGADPAATDADGMTALGLASQRQETKIINALRHALDNNGGRG